MRSLKKTRLWSSVLLFSLVHLSSVAFANQLKVFFLGNPPKIESEKNIQLQFRLELDKDFKAYLDQFKFIVKSPAGFKSGELKIDPVIKFYDKISKSDRLGFEKTGSMTVVIEAPKDFKDNSIFAQVQYQACTTTYCLFPQFVEIEIPVKNEMPSIGFIEKIKSIKFSGESANVLTLLNQNVVLTFLIVFLMGILTSFTPCVYPLIPITVSVLGRQHKGSKWKATVLYVFGLAITYAILGVLAALSGSLFGSFINHPIVISIVVGVLGFMALSEFGIIEFKTPQILENKLDKYTHSGVFVAGLVAGLIASPCVGPMLVGILTYVSQSQNALLGFSLLFVYALGMGQLLLLVGTSTHALKLLPKSGPWMDGIKDLFGFVLIIMAYYYLRPLLTQPMGDLGFSILVILISFWRGAWKVLVSKIKSEIVYSAFLLFVACAAGLWGFKQWHSPQVVKVNAENTTSIKGKKPGPWIELTSEKLEAALKSGKPVMIDFWAEWCAACFELEEKTFSDSKVKEEFTRWTLFHFDATQESKELSEFKQKFGIVGLPTVLFFDKDGNWKKDKTLTQFESPESFLKRIQSK